MSTSRRDLPETPLHASLVRPVLLAGAEREMALLEIFLAATFLTALGPRLVTLGVVLALALLVHPLLVRAAKYDPDLAKLYLRHIRYRRFYPARPHPEAPVPAVPRGIPSR